MVFGKIWREGEWNADLEPEDKFFSPADYCRAIFINFNDLGRDSEFTARELAQ